MNSGVEPFVLAVVAPPILLHFSLLAYAEAVNLLGEPPYKPVHLCRPRVLPLMALAILWGIAGMILAYPISYRMVDEIIVRVTAGCGFLTREQTFNGIQGPAYLLLWLWTKYCIDRIALKGVPVGYFALQRVWLAAAVIYWIVVGVGMYFTITHYFSHNC